MDESDQLDLELKYLSNLLDPRSKPEEYKVFLKIKRILELLAEKKDDIKKE